MDEKRLKEIVVELQNGDQSNFNEFFELTKKLVFYNCYSICKNHEQSEDLMQDSYVNFLSSIAKLDIKQSIVGYLLTISRNVSLNFVKRESKKEDYESFEPFMKTEDTYRSDEEILLDKIKKIVNDKEFEVFILRQYDELSFEEIAKLKKAPLGTILFRYNSAIKKLREGLKDEV